jgi:hypothetical protein
LDATGGLASGVSDICASNGVNLVNVQFSQPAYDPRYYNRRAEIYFKGAEAIRKGAALPPIAELVGELVTPTYGFKNGKFILSEKDQVKVILGRSPDLADAYMETYGLPEMAGGAMAAWADQEAAHALSDWDPYTERERRN